jgi:MFS family permease
LIITVALVKLKEEDADLEQDEAEMRGLLHMNDAQKEKHAKKKVPKHALLWHRDFWKLCGISVGQYYAYCYISDYYTDMGKVYFDDATLTLYGNIATVCQAVWLFAQAFFMDFVDVQTYYKRVMYFQIALCCLFFISMWGGENIFLIVLCLTYMTGGTIWIVLPLLTMEIFGIDHGGSMYGYVYPFLFIVSYTLTTFVYLFYDSLGYGGMMIICIAFTGMGIYLLSTFPEKHNFKFHEAYLELERQRQIAKGSELVSEADVQNRIEEER